LYRSELTLAALIQHNNTLGMGGQNRNVDDIVGNGNIDDYIQGELINKLDIV
jgi:hypothetical protein